MTAHDTPTSASSRIDDRDVRALKRRGFVLERADWRRPAEINAGGHVSLADSAPVVLAHEDDATLVTGGDAEAYEILTIG